jgi:1-acyl-sn-glycerol-3-phosphate acyltransferase
MRDNDFDAIRPYYTHELPAAFERIVSDPLFQQLMNYLFPIDKHNELTSALLKSTNSHEFQLAFMLPVVRSILNKTSKQLTVTGTENLSRDQGHVYIANHRDIILDSAILGLALVNEGYETSEITWGDNLIISKFVEDIGKSNKMITVFREGTPKEMLRNSQRLSAYIRQTITERKKSVWIAQRKGRAKDGYDSTDVGVLKMLSLTGDKNVVSSLKELNIIPLTISYEWEPCDGMKARELYISEKREYVKGEDEDLQSIIGGVVSEKGRIHLHFGESISNSIDQFDTSKRPNEILHEMALYIDRQIHAGYKLWPSSYIAYDLLSGNQRFKEKYDQEMIEAFDRRLQRALAIAGKNPEKLKEIFLKIYANPLQNHLDLKASDTISQPIS